MAESASDLAKTLARHIIATRDIRFASDYRPINNDYAKSWLEAAREACGDESIATLVNRIAHHTSVMAWAKEVLESGSPS